ncbi:MAG: hypothetical protein CMP23_14035 [Rickettsiales bacterium]|nr:hypothetical protein [Rickettsiales bacterium]
MLLLSLASACCAEIEGSLQTEAAAAAGKEKYAVVVRYLLPVAMRSALSLAVVASILLVAPCAEAHFTMTFTGISGQPHSWQEGAFSVTGNWTQDGGLSAQPGQLETDNWLQGGDHITSYAGQNSNWLEFTRQGVPFTPLNFHIAERSGTQTFIASSGAQLTVTGAVGDYFFFPTGDLDWIDLDWLVLHTSSGFLGLDSFSMNVCPDPVIWGPYTVDEGGAVLVSGYSEGANRNFSWDLDGDGSYDDATGQPTLFNASSLDGPSLHQIGLQVSADCGLSGVMIGTTTTTVTVENVAPNQLVLQGPDQGSEGDPLSWHLSWNDPGLQDDHTVVWDPGDGSGPVSAGDSFAHTYTDEGSYLFTVTISDDDGASASVVETITISNEAPILSGFVVPDGDEGELLSFAVQAQDSGSSDLLSYHWDFGDGSSSTGSNTAQHIFSDDGSYELVLTVSDEDGGVAIATAIVTIANLAPSIASLSVPSVGSEGSLLSLSASASDVAADTVSYHWNFGDGSQPQVGNPMAYAWPDQGSYIVTLTVLDDDGGSAQLSATVEVANEPPQIDALVLPSSDLAEGSLLLFSAAASDPGEDQLTFSWDFGDGSALLSGASVQHRFIDEGSFQISLSVSDGDGGTVQQSGSLSIANRPPEIQALTGNSAGLEAQSLSWSAQVVDSGSADSLSGSWDFGDGSAPVAGMSASHSYLDEGAYTLSFTASDNDGGVSSQSLIVSIANEGPSITSLTVPGGNEGELLQFAASAVDPGGDPLSFSWDFGDGSAVQQGAGVQHAFQDDGTYTVTLTVTDNAGGSASSSAAASIVNLPPSISQLSAPSSGNEGQLLSFSASAVDPGSVDQQSLLYTWDFGDGSPVQQGPSVQHAFSDEGSWQVQLLVDDGEGGQDSQSHLVTTSNLAPSFVSSAPLLAQEGLFYSYLPSVHEPGNDVLSFRLAAGAPSGLVLDPSNGRITWTPEYLDALGPAVSLTLIVEDEDGGLAIQSWNITVLFRDQDGDGMADSWELLQGLDPNDSADDSADPDGDGLSNLQEFIAGSDAFLFDGPGAPTLWLPEEDAEVDSKTPWLELIAAQDPQGEAVDHYFQVFADAAMGQLLAAGTVSSESENAVVRWKVPTVLAENSLVFWRASATDGWVSGPFSDLGSFFVNSDNEAPPGPSLQHPEEGALVADGELHLQWAQDPDPDRDSLHWEVQLRDVEGQLLQFPAVGSSGTSQPSLFSWPLTEELRDDTLYFWRVAAQDEHGLMGSWSDERSFRFSSENTAPVDCRLLEPELGQPIEDLAPVFLADPGSDMDGEIAEVLFEIDVVPELGSSEYMAWTIHLQDQELVSWDLAATGLTLPENRLLYVRLRCFDAEGASSIPQLGSFFSRGPNEAPLLPLPQAPSLSSSRSDAAVTLQAISYGDPEQDLHFFEFVVAADPQLEAVLRSSGPGLPSAADSAGESLVRWSVPRLQGELYWALRGIDSFGAASPWTAALPLLYPEEPQPVAAGPGCRAQSHAPGSELRPNWLVLIGVFAWLSRRRGTVPPLAKS